MGTSNVATRHPEYLSHYSRVVKTKNIFDGVDSAKQYIYQLERESDDSIITRKDNATLKNYVKRAVEAFVGMIFRKHIETTGLDDRMMEVMNRIDKRSNLNRFSRDLTTSLIKEGKAFIAVDSSIDGEGLPYAIIYDRLNVINWKKDSNGMYTMVVVEQDVEVDSLDMFSTMVVKQWRVYKDDGNVDIYQEGEDGIGFVETIETEYDYIPIIPVELDDIPPLYDIAKMNIKHMNRTSIKDKYLDMCATPIPLIWGIGTDDSLTNGTKPVFVIGADEAFLFQGTKDECDFQWRELNGSSIDKLQEDLKVIEEDITSGIIRAATSDTTTIKTATQSFYEAAESANRCVVIANAVEQGLNVMLQYLADIGNITMDETSRIIVNKDFNAINGNNQDLRLLWEMYLGGAISVETLLDSLAKYEVIDIGSVRDEIIRIENDNFAPKQKNVPEQTKQAMDNNTIKALQQ